MKKPSKKELLLLLLLLLMVEVAQQVRLKIVQEMETVVQNHGLVMAIQIVKISNMVVI